MLFLFQDSDHRARIPLSLSETSRHLLLFQFFRNLCRSQPPEKIPVNASYRLCLFSVDYELSILILVIPQKFECIEMHLTVLELCTDSPFAVL